MVLFYGTFRTIEACQLRSHKRFRFRVLQHSVVVYLKDWNKSLSSRERLHYPNIENLVKTVPLFSKTVEALPIFYLNKVAPPPPIYFSGIVLCLTLLYNGKSCPVRACIVYLFHRLIGKSKYTLILSVVWALDKSVEWTQQDKTLNMILQCINT